MGPWRRGSASRSQREGRGFESRRLHQTVPPVARLTRHPCGQTLIMHWKKRWEGPSRPRWPSERSRLVSGRSPVRIRLGALGRRPRHGGPGGRRRGVMDASLCVNGAIGSTAVSKTVDSGSSPDWRAMSPFSPGTLALGENGDDFMSCVKIRRREGACFHGKNQPDDTTRFG